MLLFADDKVLLTKNIDDMQKILDRVSKFSTDTKMKFGIDE